MDKKEIVQKVPCFCVTVSVMKWINITKKKLHLLWLARKRKMLAALLELKVSQIEITRLLSKFYGVDSIA